MNAWFEALTGCVLLEPWWLLLALLLPTALLRARRRGEPSVTFAPGPVADDLPRSWRSRLVRLPEACTALGLASLLTALARPVERVELPLATRGIDIVLCLDASSSMAANDMAPQRTRLDLARDAAIRFVRDRPGDRIGLVRFARFPDVLCPPTLDHPALERFLTELGPVEADSGEDLTGIGTAVGRAAQVLHHGLARSKVVVLLTDGEENVATEETPEEIGPLAAARLCEELGVRVYSIAAGIGKRAADGQLTPLDTSQIRALAERTGGRFFAARDAAAIADVYATIDGLEQTEFEEPRYELLERFLPWLCVGALLVLLARLARATVFEVLP